MLSALANSARVTLEGSTLEIDDKLKHLYPEMAYFMNESLSDVVFIVEGNKIPALKQILCLKSDVFKAMFSDNFKESTNKEVIIEDTTYEAFKTLIGYLYCEELVFPDRYNYRLIEEICKLSDRYQVLRLINKIGDHLKEIIKIENLKIIAKISFTYKLDALMERVNQFIDTNFNEVVNKSKADLNEINQMTNNRVFDISIIKYRNLKKEHGKTESLYKEFSQTSRKVCSNGPNGRHYYYEDKNGCPFIRDPCLI